MGLTTFDFGMAIVHADRDANNIISRNGWNGKNMYVKVCADSEISVSGEKKTLNKHFVIKNVDGSFSTWVPSVNDCLAKDWVLSTLEEFNKQSYNNIR
jgi:glutathione synthase/RimK-type ligase-like ATP-grasp enzyme